MQYKNTLDEWKFASGIKGNVGILGNTGDKGAPLSKASYTDEQKALLKGNKGARGADGATPILFTDYLNNADKIILGNKIKKDMQKKYKLGKEVLSYRPYAKDTIVTTDTGEVCKRIEYISSSGTQWINTGISMNSHTIEIDLKSVSKGSYFFGSDNGGNCYMLYADSTNGYFYFKNETSSVFSANKVITSGAIVKAQAITPHYYTELYVDGVKYTTSYLAQKAVASTPAILFGYRNASEKTFCGTASIRRCTIYNKEGILVKNLLPVIDNSNVACMYDTVTKKLFYNQGTGVFSKGSIIEDANCDYNHSFVYYDKGDIKLKHEFRETRTVYNSIYTSDNKKIIKYVYDLSNYRKIGNVQFSSFLMNNYYYAIKINDIFYKKVNEELVATNLTEEMIINNNYDNFTSYSSFNMSGGAVKFNLSEMENVEEMSIYLDKTSFVFITDYYCYPKIQAISSNDLENWAEKISYAHIYASDTTKLSFSTDGEIYKIFDGTSWIEDTANGMSQSEINNLTEENWNMLLGSTGGNIFTRYYLYDEEKLYEIKFIKYDIGE